MKGYFSQLAQQTGLSFEAGSTTAASSSAAAPTVLAQHEGSAAPPHVEEITFSAPTAANVFERNIEGSSEGRVDLPIDESRSVSVAERPHRRRTESTDSANFQSAAMAKTLAEAFRGPLSEESRVRFADSESSTRQTHYAGGQPSADEQQKSRLSNERSPAAPRPGTRESFASVEVVPGQFEDELPVRNPPALEAFEAPEANAQERNLRELSDAALDERMEREVIVHNYLKEVRAWVAATPEIGDSELDRQRQAEVRQESRDVFGLEQEPDAPSPSQPGRREGLEVQDHNLSIGSISIVIEEPKQNAPVALAPPARVERSPERTMSEPTRLSRYYLRSW